MRLRWILVAVTFLLAGVLVLYASDGTSEPGRAPAAKGTDAVGTAAPDAASRDSTLATRTAAAGPSKQEPRGTPADVLVVDGASAPVAGAEVSWYDMASVDALGLPQEELGRLWGDPEEIARRCGGRTRSDAHGIARVILSGRTFLLAHHDSKFARLDCYGLTKPPPEGLRIVLVPDRTLCVQVLEASGRPAIGVDVSTQSSGGEIPWCGPGGRTEAPDGIATLRHLQAHPAMSSSSSWFAEVQVPGCEQLHAAFDKDAPPEQPLVFRLPACGSLRVAVDLRGRQLRPLPPPAYASTYTHSVLVEIRGGHRDGQFFGNPFRATLGSDGFAVFARVPVGVKYLVSAHAPREAAESAVDGPASEGACADVRVTLPDDFVALEGRLVRANGEPVRDTMFQVESEAGERSFGIPAAGGFAVLVTDDAGGFVVPVGRLPEGARLHSFVGKWEATDGSASLHVALEPRELVHGWNQLGSVVAAAGEVLVAGRFVTDGPGEQYVSFAVEALQPAQDGTSPAVWSAVPDLAISQRDGAFVVRGRARIGRHRLTFPSPTHLQVAPVEFEPGRSDLTVHIESGHPFAARVRVHPGAPLGFFARLRPEAAAPSEDAVSRQRRCVMMLPDAAGLAQPQWTAVRAGTYTLDLLLAGAEAPLLSVPHVAVPQPDGGDPRLDGIDLRTAYGLAFVRASHANGDPLEEIRVLPAIGDLDAEWWMHPVGERGVVVPVPTGAARSELVVAHQDLRPLRVRAAPGVVQVTLETWDAVEAELVFQDLPPLPEGLALQVCARVPDPPDAVVTILSLGSGSRQERDFLLDDHPPRFVNDRSVRVPFGAGRRPIHVTLHRVWLAPIPIPTEPREAAASESPIAVRIDAEALRAAIAKLSAAR